MKKVNYAAIDVGSNAVRLLIKGLNREAASPDERFTKELLLRVPLRLGFDVFTLGKLSDAKAVKLKRLMKAFRQLMKIYEVADYRACATSAMRDAKNGDDLLKKIEKDTGIHIEIIDGKEEAAIIYNNHLEYLGDRKGNYLYVDVGGGSTEVNFLTNGELVYSASYNIGTVRMLSNAVEESVWNELKNDLAHLSELYPDINIIGSGGNINKLFRMAEQKDKKRQCMTVATLRELYAALNSLSVEERIRQYKLKADRADVIIPACEIYLTIARIIKAENIFVPIIGLSDGIIDKLLLEEKEEDS